MTRVFFSIKCEFFCFLLRLLVRWVCTTALHKPSSQKKGQRKYRAAGRASHVTYRYELFIFGKRRRRTIQERIARLTSALTAVLIQKASTRVARGGIDYTEIEAGNLAENNPSDSNVQAPQSFQKKTTTTTAS